MPVVCHKSRHFPVNIGFLVPQVKIFTVFEGTSEIQHLVIARAISGLHIE